MSLSDVASDIGNFLANPKTSDSLTAASKAIDAVVSAWNTINGKKPTVIAPATTVQDQVASGFRNGFASGLWDRYGGVVVVGSLVLLVVVLAGRK